jgi:hypothetical protein
VSVAAFRTFAGVLSSGSGTQQPSEREFKLATFQQLVTTPTVKEHLASSLQNNPICALLTARPGEAESGTERRDCALRRGRTPDHAA